MAALRALGGSNTFAKRVGLGMRWFLFGYPLLFIIYVIISIVVGRESVMPPVSSWLTWLLAIPFWVSMLVMLQTLPFLLGIDIANRSARKLRGHDLPRRGKAIATMLPLLFFLLYTPTRILLDRSDLNLHTYAIGNGYAPLRIVFVGDLQQDHMTGPTRANEVVELVNAQRADLVLSGGDWINTGPEFIDEATASAGKLKSRLGTFSSEGDHENFAYRDQERSMREVRDGLSRHGVELLHNEVRYFAHEGKRLAVIFAAYNYIYRTPEGELRALIASAHDADYAILVTHQFDAFLAGLAKDAVDLVLAGHTHGGQVNPVVGFWHVPLARVETEYIEGRYRLSPRTTVIVTAGIGFSLAPFRYASPASIEVIDLHL